MRRKTTKELPACPPTLRPLQIYPPGLHRVGQIGRADDALLHQRFPRQRLWARDLRQMRSRSSERQQILQLAHQVRVHGHGRVQYGLDAALAKLDEFLGGQRFRDVGARLAQNPREETRMEVLERVLVVVHHGDLMTDLDEVVVREPGVAEIVRERADKQSENLNVVAIVRGAGPENQPGRGEHLGEVHNVQRLGTPTSALLWTRV